MCRFLNIIILLNMTLTLMNGETRINPYVSDLGAEQLKQHLEHRNTYGWQISFLRSLLPWSTIPLASPVQSLHPELKPCLKIATSSSILYNFKYSRSHGILEINRDGASSLSSRADATWCIRMCCFLATLSLFPTGDQLVCCQLPPAHLKHHSAFPGWALHVRQVVGQRGW